MPIWLLIRLSRFTAQIKSGGTALTFWYIQYLYMNMFTTVYVCHFPALVDAHFRLVTFFYRFLTSFPYVTYKHIYVYVYMPL